MTDKSSDKAPDKRDDSWPIVTQTTPSMVAIRRVQIMQTAEMQM